jgi:Tfp pilus assembly protein PilN
MIKINLLAEKKPTKEKGPIITIETGENKWKAFLLIGILLLVIIIIGWYWVSLETQTRHLISENEKADKELKRLEDVRKKRDLYQQQRDLLERKINILLDLKKAQKIPVHILDQISRNLPDFLWLTSISEKGSVITIKGKATTYNAVSNFYNNLDRSPHFYDVTLGQTKEISEGVTFTLKCTFTLERESPKKAQKEMS